MFDLATGWFKIQQYDDNRRYYHHKHCRTEMVLKISLVNASNFQQRKWKGSRFSNSDQTIGWNQSLLQSEILRQMPWWKGFIKIVESWSIHLNEKNNYLHEVDPWEISNLPYYCQKCPLLTSVWTQTQKAKWEYNREKETHDHWTYTLMW